MMFNLQLVEMAPCENPGYCAFVFIFNVIERLCKCHFGANAVLVWFLFNIY